MAYLVEAARNWKTMERRVQRKYYFCIVLVMCTLLFLFFILKPTPDVEEIALKNQIANAPAIVQAQFPSMDRKFTAVITGAFLDWLLPSILFVLLTAAWCIWRHRWAAYVLSVGTLVVFYCLVHGAPHHHGTVFIAAITGIWIAWPTKGERRVFSHSQRLGFVGVQTLLLALCVVNVVDGAAVIKREYLYPYSGGKDAADFLKSEHADRGVMFGFLHGVVAIQAYFDHNIFANTPTAYYHHGLPLINTLNLEELHRLQPEYVVSYSDTPDALMQQGAPTLFANGYVLAHFSDGYYLYKRGVFERETYFVFKKFPNAVSDATQPSGTAPDLNGRGTEP